MIEQLHIQRKQSFQQMYVRLQELIHFYEYMMLHELGMDLEEKDRFLLVDDHRLL